MFTAIALARLFALGLMAVLVLSYLDDTIHDRLGKALGSIAVTGASIALFVYLMGWLG
ncbi:hypothetical protein LCGC14_2405260 [marine sediment metagenome]|uniref:Uncharacterized protein n=1 Tax=marine sediment metagenome TaxID=412755 RepID=A0A0F9BU65_9ZZZZ